MSVHSANKSLSRGTNLNEPGTATCSEIVFTQDYVNINFYVCDKWLALMTSLTLISLIFFFAIQMIPSRCY